MNPKPSRIFASFVVQKTPFWKTRHVRFFQVCGLAAMRRTFQPGCFYVRFMKKYLLGGLALGFAVVRGFAAGPSVIPEPAEVRMPGGAPFVVTPQTVVHYSGGAEGEAKRLAQWLGLKAVAGGHGGIEFNLSAPAKTVANQYTLTVHPDGIVLAGGAPQDLFYAAQTLRQLLPPDAELDGARANGGHLEVPAVEIVDHPRFLWRGAMLDVSRHFASVADVKRFLDLMALHKLNVFHWHLVDDQGWRIEIRGWPKLTATGAWRAQSPLPGGNQGADGVPHGGFYTQDEVREIVAYAAARYITIVPEIELPGHSSAAIAAYPELGNTDAPGFAPKVQERWGVFTYLYAPRPQALKFLDDVLGQVAELFPGTFVHVGGDEAKKDQWDASPVAQAFIKEHGLKDAHELQSWFIRHAQEVLAAHHKRLVGWDEIQEGGLAENATMMAWRDVKWAIAAAHDGHDVVMAPKTHTYLDYTEGTPEEEGEKVGRQLTLATVYSFEPVAPELSPDEAKHVLGAQAQLWREQMPGWAKVEYRAFPRLSALAEVVWSPKEKRNFADFKTRLPWLLARFDRLGVNYRRPRPTDQ